MMIKLGHFFFRYRNGLFPLAFAFALLVDQPAFPLGRHDLDTAFDLAGAAVAFLGLALRALTVGYEYIIRGGRNGKVFAETLVQGGVFAHCRNPLYLGNILIAVGLALMSQSTAFYLIFIPFILFAYASIVAAEEAYLLGKFGAEYEDYCRRVNRWWPRWAGFSRSIEGMRFNWNRVIVKEYSTTLWVIALLPAMEVWSDYRILGESELPPAPYLLAAVLAWLGLYLTVRTLKIKGCVRG